MIRIQFVLLNVIKMESFNRIEHVFYFTFYIFRTSHTREFVKRDGKL